MSCISDARWEKSQEEVESSGGAIVGVRNI
jgi:hypothetical protein